MTTKYRTGRKVGRTIYRQTGPGPTDSDELIGMMDTRELAAFAVAAMNAIANVGARDREQWLATAVEREIESMGSPHDQP